MKRIGITGTNLEDLVCAHQILDNDPKTTVYLIDPRAEAGLDEEGPGLIQANSWPPLPKSWLGQLGSQEPTINSTAVRRSWFEKALATKLSERGGIFLMRTIILEEKKDGGKTIIKLGGAGPSKDEEITLDNLIKSEKQDENILWSGGVYSDKTSNEEIIGSRPDGLTEIWWEGENTHKNNPLELMKWRGKNPSTSIKDTIILGISMANSI